MADTTTTTYGLVKPEVGASEDTWGTKINTNLDNVDNLLDGTTPVTGIDINSGSIDGTPIGANSASTIAGTTISGTTGTFSGAVSGTTGTFSGAITSGGNITVGGTNNLIVNDSGVAIFGDDGDLSIGNSGTIGLISAPNGDITLDTAGVINLDADGGFVEIKDGGNSRGKLICESDGFTIRSMLNNGDFRIKGVDGGSEITALTLDMSDAGTASFNHDIKLPDSGQAIFGDSSDLQIYHDGSHSYINDSGSGYLILKGNVVEIKGSNNDMCASFSENGATQLYYDNAAKLATTSSGVTVTGSVHASSFGLDSNDYLGWGNNSYLDFVINGGIRARIESDGDIHADGNVIAYSTTISDERLKKDIVKIDNALDKVSQLNGYTFEYLADGKKSAGVIAQEVEKVMPSAITESTLPLKMGEDDKTEYKTVQYDQLHGLMIEAIKELKAEIEELKAR